MRAGMITGGLGCVLASAKGSGAKLFLRRKTMRPVVRRLHRVEPGGERLAHRVALHPARERGGAVLRRARACRRGRGGPSRSLMVQRRPSSSIRVPLRHLRMRLQVGVEPVERVVDEEGVVPRHRGRRPDRVEAGQVGLRHEDEGARRRRARRARAPAGAERASGARPSPAAPASRLRRFIGVPPGIWLATR